MIKARPSPIAGNMELLGPCGSVHLQVDTLKLIQKEGLDSLFERGSKSTNSLRNVGNEEVGITSLLRTSIIETAEDKYRLVIAKLGDGKYLVTEMAAHNVRSEGHVSRAVPLDDADVERFIGKPKK